MKIAHYHIHKYSCKFNGIQRPFLFYMNLRVVFGGGVDLYSGKHGVAIPSFSLLCGTSVCLPYHGYDSVTGNCVPISQTSVCMADLSFPACTIDTFVLQAKGTLPCCRKKRHATSSAAVIRIASCRIGRTPWCKPA